MLAGVIVFAGFIWFQSPLLINPAEIIGRIQSGAGESTTLETMATLLPVMVIIIVVLMLALIGVMYAAFANEKKYIALMEDGGADNNRAANNTEHQ